MGTERKKLTIHLFFHCWQCCGCNAYHKLVDHLNLFQETNCYLNSSFNYKGPGWDDLKFRFMDVDSDSDDDIFPVT